MANVQRALVMSVASAGTNFTCLLESKLDRRSSSNLSGEKEKNVSFNQLRRLEIIGVL